ncbi:hypothetical protein CMI47_19000 [Candidatus Pacearchaeota archaeon]|nr:hypothetical protein [Candidatus Pacearchaeota archaeon]|tara:strand:- start:9442 stop:9723 length:282 start_codon:yes stop_codon:yes gene_type:complete
MSMPKGYKTDHGYATVRSHDDGLGYREIAECMTEMGHKMNHSTARNIFLSAMTKFAENTCSLYGVKPTCENVKRISSDPRFQSGILDMIKLLD